VRPTMVRVAGENRRQWWWRLPEVGSLIGRPGELLRGSGCSVTYARRREGGETRYSWWTAATEIEDRGGRLTHDGRWW
jgi:hypothetical protein